MVCNHCCGSGIRDFVFRLFGRQGLYASIVISLLWQICSPKLTEIFGLQTSMGVILSSIYFATDLLSERYGKAEATRAVMIGFTVSVIIIVMISMSLLSARLSASSTELAQRMHEATATLFDFTPRFVLGSLLAYLVSQRFDVWIFHNQAKNSG